MVKKILLMMMLSCTFVLNACSLFDVTNYSPDLKNYQRSNDSDYQNCEVKFRGSQSNESFKTTDLPGETSKFHLCRSSGKIVLMEGETFRGNDPWSKKCLKSKGKIFTKRYGVGYHQNGKVQDTVYANSYVCLLNGVVTSAINN